MNFGIIGYGKMGKIRYAAIRDLPGCRVSRICEVNAQEDFPEGVAVTADPDEIMNDRTIDAVVISTPNQYLKDLVIQGLNSGKHVFCEKPPGRTLAELEEMMAAQRENPSCKLMFGFNHRHHESMLHARKLIDSGEYGKVLWLRGRYGKSVDESFFTNWRSQKSLAGGGILLDQGIHMLDLFLMFCGDFEEVQAFVSNLYWKLDIEDNVFANLRNSRGQVASLHSTMTQWRHLFSLEIFLERGYITINGLKTPSGAYGDEIMSIAQNRSLPPAAVWTQQEDMVFHTDQSWERELKMFAECVRNDSPVPTGNSADAYKLLRLIEKIYQQKDAPWATVETGL